MFEFPMWLAQLSVAFLLVLTVALVVSRLLRDVRIVSPQPFKSRQEYLNAAFEMDLDLFLQRVAVTPRNVILKPKLCFEINCGNKGCPCQPSGVQKPELIKPVPLFWDVSATTLGAIGGSGAIGPHGGMATQRSVMGSFQAAECGCLTSVNFGRGEEKKSDVAYQPFKKGQWVRIKRPTSVLDHALGQIVSFGVDVITCFTPDGSAAYVVPDELEPAYPMAGEWWRWTKYELLSGAQAVDFSPFRWVGDTYLGNAEADVAAGNIVPVNFGKGEEKKSGVA